MSEELPAKHHLSGLYLALQLWDKGGPAAHFRTQLMDLVRQAEESKADNRTNAEVPKIPAIWAKSLVDCWPDDANDFDGDWCIGVISEDGEPREVVKVEASQYDAAGESQKIAEAIVLLWAFAARAQAGGGS